jgi:hypothetical protein
MRIIIDILAIIGGATVVLAVGAAILASFLWFMKKIGL